MNSLQKIQNAFRIIQILTKIAYIFTIIGAACCAIGAVCVMAMHSGEQVFRFFGESVIFIREGEKINQIMATLLSVVVLLSTDAVLLYFSGQYFIMEQAQGTPFTNEGADLLKKLGIRCIYMPIVAIVISAVITACLGAEGNKDVSNLPGVVTGILLLLASLICRYGAELEHVNENKEINP